MAERESLAGPGVEFLFSINRLDSLLLDDPFGVPYPIDLSALSLLDYRPLAELGAF